MALSPHADGGLVTSSRLLMLVRIRWVGLAYAVLQLLLYRTLPYPVGVQAAGFAIVGVLAVANAVLAVSVTRTGTAALPRLGLASVVLDLLGLSSLVWLFAFDPISAHFALLVLVPVEAAVLFGLPGALWGWAAVAGSYLGREWYGTAFGNPVEPDSVTFRLGLIGIVALVVGFQSRDLHRQREAAGAALLDARRADVWRGRLVGMLAHDLRSPLAGARTGLATLREHRDRLSSEDATRILDGTIRQVDRMLAMTRDLLDLARSEQARLVLDAREVALAEVVTRAADLVGATRDGTVQVDVPAGLHVVADPDRLEQVVANLLTNALRHGAPPVEVTAWSDGPEVCLAVRDHGAGLPESLQDRIFEPFVTTEDGAAATGLGTWVIQALVDLHGGAVRYEDAEPGARFVVALPVEGPALSEAGPSVS